MKLPEKDIFKCKQEVTFTVLPAPCCSGGPLKYSFTCAIIQYYHDIYGTCSENHGEQDFTVADEKMKKRDERRNACGQADRAGVYEQ